MTLTENLKDWIETLASATLATTNPQAMVWD